MEVIDRLDNVRRAWALASSKGYFRQAIIDYTAPDFFNLMVGLIPGLLAALAIPIVGQIGGTAAGTALGVAITAFTGQAEVVPVLANIGRVIGGLAANAVLVYLGLMFLKDYMMPRIGAVGEHIGKGCSDAYNAPPNAGDRMLDGAAKEMAEGVGYLLGLVLFAIVAYVSKGPTERLIQLRNSFLARTCPKVMDWVFANLIQLTERYRTGVTKTRGGVTLTLLQGGAIGVNATALQTATQLANNVLSQLINRGTRMVSVRNITEMNAVLTRFGFRLIRREPYGPDGGWQLFWQNGNVLVRFKTLGDKAGPRANRPHLSVGYNDGKGLDWQNDLAKFTFDGKVVAKVITDPANFKPLDFQGNPQKFVLLPTDFDMAAVDAWAAKTHFNADGSFTLDGLGALTGQGPGH